MHLIGSTTLSWRLHFYVQVTLPATFVVASTVDLTSTYHVVESTFHVASELVL